MRIETMVEKVDGGETPYLFYIKSFIKKRRNLESFEE
jgi:hypothetical protein